MKVLHIFDFDDTLIQSKSSIIVKHGNGSESVLSSEEYATYDELPDDSLDFSDFDRYPYDAEIIEDVFDELFSSIEKDGIGSVVILTARANPEPVREFLNNHGARGVDIHAVGSSNPRDKAVYVLSRITEGDINLVRVFEDNVRNIREIRKIVKESGETSLQTHRVSNGKIVSIRKESRQS